MRLTRDCLLTYPGYHGTRGICHARVYKGLPWQRPVVIVGDFPGMPWSSVANTAEGVAGEVQYELLKGLRRFRLIEYSHSSTEGPGQFREITFTRGEPPHQGRTMFVLAGLVATTLTHSKRPRGRFTRPRASRVNVEAAVGHRPQTWAKDEYRPETVAADRSAAARVVDEIRRHNAIANADLDALESEFF
jgi:hypothetical protein